MRENSIYDHGIVSSNYLIDFVLSKDNVREVVVKFEVPRQKLHRN